ncbi:MAG: GerMN domain-containing protein [Spirochaetes bacterium]|nr:GerMN domain-containing protein [Spirochaetota bacterium]
MARGKRGLKLGKTGCLFWLLILIVIVIVVLYRSKGSFKDTFRSLKVFGEKAAEVTQKQTEKIVEPPKTDIVNEPETPPEPAGSIKKPAEKEPAAATPPEEKKETGEDVKKPPGAQTIRTKSIEATVYFVKIDEGDGSAEPFGVKRTVQYKDSPITKTLEILLEGVTPGEKNAGVISFIPGGTKLISAGIKNGHLTIDFSESLEENYQGRAAILLELSQILLTCFSFDAVDKVTILINGARKEYITGEGVPLEAFYSRRDVSRLVSGG